jgi:hypothetical protein
VTYYDRPAPNPSDGLIKILVWRYVATDNPPTWSEWMAIPTRDWRLAILYGLRARRAGDWLVLEPS